MSDNVQFLVDEQVSAEDAEKLASALLARLITDGWLDPTATEDCALEGSGHPPGPRAVASCPPQPREAGFTKLAMNGVVVSAARFTNLTFPFETDALVCPRCEEPVDEDLLMDAVDAWMSSKGDGRVACEGCGEASHLRAWQGEAPVVCGELALSFYNWPPLASPRWKASVIDVVGEVLGHAPALASAKL